MRLASAIPVPPISIVAMVMAFTCKRSGVNSRFLLLRHPPFFYCFFSCKTAILLLLIHSVRFLAVPINLYGPDTVVQKIDNRLLSFWHAHIFLAHVVIAKDVTFFISATFKGCWTNLRMCQGCMRLSKLPDAATLPSLFFNLKAGHRCLQSFRSAISGETPWAWWHSTAYSTSKSASIVMLLVLGNSPSHQVHRKHGEGLQLSYRLKDFVFMQTFICHCYPLTSSYKLTKACWCWGFSGFSQKQPVYLAVRLPHRILSESLLGRVLWVLTRRRIRWSLAVLVKRVLKRICGSSTKMVISVSRGMVVSSSEAACLTVHKLDNASLLRIQLFIRWPGSSSHA